MRIEVCAGALGGVSVMDFQTDIRSFLSDQEALIASFKTVSSSTVALNGGVGALQGALDDIQSRILVEEEALTHAQSVQTSMNGFLDLAQRVDRQVASDVDRNKEEFYGKYPDLRPADSDEEEKAWYEKAWEALCGVGEAIKEGVEALVDAVGETLTKAWDSLVEFYEKYKVEIINWTVTILCVVGSIVAIALIPVTGGASILVVAGISAISSGIIAATQSITAHYAETGSWEGIDWSEVAKDAAIGAAIGAITGAIGAGVGNAVTKVLTNVPFASTFLSSQSTITRMLAGSFIGSISEGLSGILSRGAGEAAVSILEDGEIDFGDVMDAAFDPEQIILDLAIGGASGGFEARRPMDAPDVDTPQADSLDSDGTDWSRTANTPEEEAILRELEESGVIQSHTVDPSKPDPVKETSHIPQSTGEFTGEPGNSDFIPKNQEALDIMKEYGVDKIPYRNGDSDFSALTKHDSPWGELDGKVEIGHMTDQRTNGKWELGRRPKGTSHDPNYDIGNFAQADNEVAKQFAHLGITGKDIENYRKANGLTWHESADGKTMMLIPTKVHDACPHSGGVSEKKYRMQWGDITLPY